MTTMNILLLTAEYPPAMRGGLANYSYNLARGLTRNNDVMVAVLPSDPTIKRYTAYLQYIYSMGKKINELRKEKKLDIVYAITFQPQFSAIGLYTKIINVPFVSNGIGLDIYTYHPLFVQARKIAYSVSEQLICGTNFQKEIMLNEGASAKKINVIPGGVDTEIFRPLYKERDELRKFFNVEGKFVLLSLGRLVKRKGFDNAIKALIHLDDISDIILLIVGRGPEKRFLTNLAKTSSLNDKVRFLGFVSPDYLPKVYSVADLFVAPFKVIGRDMEGFPLVVQEAQACGVPVITTNTAGVPELIQNDKTGFLVNMNSPEEIAEKVRMLYEDRRLLSGLSRKARERAEEIFDWQVVVTKIENVLRGAFTHE